MTVHKVSLSSLKLILIAFFLIFTSAVFVSPADASTDEMVSWSGAADWQAAEERSHVEIDVDSLKWSLREIFDRRTETVEDWDDVHSLKMLESDLQFMEDLVIADFPTGINETYNNSSTGYIGNVQYWTVPETALYQITAYGAQGGIGRYGGGEGVGIRGAFYLEQGEQINIVVGQQGQNYSYAAGGGSFVWKDCS